MDAIGGLDADDLGAGEGSYAAGFRCQDVSSAVAKDRVRRLGQVAAEGDLIAHCAREDEKGGFVRG